MKNKLATVGESTTEEILLFPINFTRDPLTNCGWIYVLLRNINVAATENVGDNNVNSEN